MVVAYRSRARTLALFASIAALSLTFPREAAAFCGFYVAGADAQLSNNATMVVLMRDGTRTVLSMANNYQGPPQDFAMVVPVPVVLQKDDVRVLPAEIFDRVDQLAAPRLVEYWERDPCYVEPEYELVEENPLQSSVERSHEGKRRANADFGVKIEAQFEVGEYQIVILSAKESTGLETWLRREKYNIPAGARALLEPYVQTDSKFFVAKVDARKVDFDEHGMAMLSPLRFHYDSQEFALPVRLGLINSAGAQDLLIHILGRGVRYELANYDNVAIPTNLDVQDRVRHHFGQFYASLFDHTLAQHPNAVVTEYAWSANTCDPCPVESLTLDELVTLGADVLPRFEPTFRSGRVARELQWSIPQEFVLTRLHARYDASSLGEDLVFQAAPAIVGGHEGGLGHGAVISPTIDNRFQARYVIRHPWTGPIDCANPRRGIWGGPWSGLAERPTVARDLAFAQRGAALTDFVTDSVAERIEADLGPLPAGPIAPPQAGRNYDLPGDDTSGSGGCAHCRMNTAESTAGAMTTVGLALLGLLGLARRRRP